MKRNIEIPNNIKKYRIFPNSSKVFRIIPEYKNKKLPHDGSADPVRQMCVMLCWQLLFSPFEAFRMQAG